MPLPHLVQKLRHSHNSHHNSLVFPEGIDEIHLYGYNIMQGLKKRRYLIELHISDGFAMVKFYPKCLQKNKRKFELRGNEIGYTLSKPCVFELIYACAIVMRDYLEINPDNFVGYIGQTDSKDNRINKRRNVSQRSAIYNPLVDTIFTYPKYKLSSRRIFEEVNLRLIRKSRANQEGKITSKQMVNYQSFLKYFEIHKIHHFDLMTEETRLKYLEN